LRQKKFRPFAEISEVDFRYLAGHLGALIGLNSQNGFRWICLALDDAPMEGLTRLTYC
jgi:hypothetical protein